MYQIAVCDDDEKELDIAEKLLKEYRPAGEERRELFLVERFTSAGELYFRISEGSYLPDLWILDIYMPGQDGMDTARQLRESGYKGAIIFVSFSREHALNAFGVSASMYLVKPLQREPFYAALDKVFGEVERERQKYLILRLGGMLSRVSIDSIVFCEAQGNYQCLHFRDGTRQRIRMTMTEFYSLVSGYEEFTRVGVAYTINLAHAVSINAREVRFSSGEMIHLPRGVYPKLKESYFTYYFGG